MEYKKLFPVFKEYKNLVYLDNAATTQKPEDVIEKLNKAMINLCANPNRGAYDLSVSASKFYEKSRKKVKDFLNVKDDYEVIFTAGTTESINFISSSLNVENKKNIVLSISSHHSNILPWQRLAKNNDLELRYMYLDDELEKIDSDTLIVAFPMIANSDGKKSNTDVIIKRAKKVGALTFVDGAQSVGHLNIDVSNLNADFFVFSGHKMFALTGIGVICAKNDVLDKLEPYYLGGDMIEYVEEQSANFAPSPTKFEAGSQNLFGALSLLFAIDFIEKIGIENIKYKEKELYIYAKKRLENLDFLEIYTKDEGAIIAFNVKDVHPHDVASILNEYNVCIRAGHHCSQPYIKKMGVYSTCRISFSIYNTKEDIDKLVVALYKVKEIFNVR